MYTIMMSSNLFTGWNYCHSDLKNSKYMIFWIFSCCRKLHEKQYNERSLEEGLKILENVTGGHVPSLKADLHGKSNSNQKFTWWVWNQNIELEKLNIYYQTKILFWGLPWWCSGWEFACRFRGHGFEPWSGRIPHAAERLGPWATAAEPARLEPVLRNKRGHDGEKPAHRDEEWPPLASTGESPRTETKTQHSQK